MTVSESQQPAMAKLKVAVVDLSLPDEEAAAALIDAHELGNFCYVINHGVPDEVIEGAFTASHEFFQLPADEKLKVKTGSNGNFRGYSPLGSEVFDLTTKTQPDTKEIFFFTTPFQPGTEAQRLYEWSNNCNQFPKDVLPEMEAAVTSYHTEVSFLGQRLVSLFARGLGVAPNAFAHLFRHPHVYGRFNHYSETKSSPQEGLFSAGAHTDYGVCTILATDTVPGLQVCQGGEWHTVPHLPGAFVVNTGRVMERWTNGRLQPILHRVVNTTGRQRTSIALFYNCSLDVPLAVQPAFATPPGQEPTEAERQPVVSYRTHLTGIFARTTKDWAPTLTTSSTTVQAVDA